MSAESPIPLNPLNRPVFEVVESPVLDSPTLGIISPEVTAKMAEMGVDASLIRYEVMVVTPEMAAEWLRFNSVNRTLRPNRVAMYARSIASGNWVFTGDAIVRDVDGQLLQGQHRCEAVVKSGRSIVTMVVVGVPSSVMEMMDAGAGRSAADAFGRRGVENCALMAAIARMTVAYTESSLTMSVVIDRPSLLEFHDIHTESLERALKIGSGVNTVIGHSPSAWAALAWVLAQLDRGKTEEFFHAMTTGAGLEEGDPRLTFRNTMSKMKSSVPSRSMRLTQTEVFNNGMKCWNMWVKGRQVSKFQRWIPGSPNPIPLIPAPSEPVMDISGYPGFDDDDDPASA